MEIMTMEWGMEHAWSDKDMLLSQGVRKMETITIEAGTERAWSDQDMLAQGGYGFIPDAAYPGSAIRKAVTLDIAFERVWSDNDLLPAISTLKKAA